MKKFIISLLILLMVAVPITAKDFSLVPATYPVLVNGQQLPVDKPVLNLDGTTYVPLRSVLDIMGAQTEWSGGKVNINVKKWDTESLQVFLNTQYSVLIIKADMPGGMISQGSGFAVLDGSYVVTNAHVVKNDIDKVIQVKNFLEETTYDFDVVLKDEHRDIAILKSKTRPWGYTPVKLGDSDKIKIGDGVIAFGYPYDSDRQCPTGTGKVTGISNYNGIKYIEDSVFTSPGSSGGALLNNDGEVIGVTSGQSNDLITNFSIPINEVKSLLNTLN